MPAAAVAVQWNRRNTFCYWVQPTCSLPTVSHVWVSPRSVNLSHRCEFLSLVFASLLLSGQWYNFNWYWAGVLIQKYKQASGCMCPQLRVVLSLCRLKLSVFNTEGISVASRPHSDMNNKTETFSTQTGPSMYWLATYTVYVCSSFARTLQFYVNSFF